jgi:hypothetical protein
MNRERDREIEELFEDDAELREIANVLRATPLPGVDPDPAFRASLRRRLMDEAERGGEEQPPTPWYLRWLSAPGRLAWAGQVAIKPRLAWSGGIAALLVLALLGVWLVNRPSHHGPVQVMIPIQNSQSVAVVTPIPIKFSQPMERASTEKAISIQPATEVSFRWPNPSELDITPKNGSLAPGTRYQVTVGAGATTEDGQKLAQAQTASFVTVPPPTPTPPPAPTPSPPQNLVPTLVGAHRVGDIGDAPAVWSTDGGQLYFIDPTGQLDAYNAASGAVQTLAEDVTTVAATPSGPAYALQSGDVVWNGQTIKDVDPAAIGFRAGRLLFVTDEGVASSDHSINVPLSGSVSAASFSPDGNRVAYLGDHGLHLVDIGSGRDRPVQQAPALGAWAPKSSSQYAYPNQSSVVFVDPTAGTASRTLGAAGVTGISWSQDDQLLLAGPSGLSIVPAAGGTPAKLSSDAITQPQWSPAANRLLSYDQDGGLWVAQVSNGRPQYATQQDLVAAFMAARKAGATMQAMQFLDAAGEAAFQRIPLVYGNGQALSRYQVLLDETGRVVVRLIVDTGSGESGVDETLTLLRDGQGRLVIHGATDSPPRSLGQGPEVVMVRVGGNQVTVTFDSDLDPSSVSGVMVSGGIRPSSTNYDPRNRSIVLTFADGLDSKATYKLLITGGVRDVGHRSAAPSTIAFTGIPGGETVSPNPTPSTAPSASPAPPSGPPASPSPSPAGH